MSAPLVAELVGPKAEELVGILIRDGLWVVPDELRDGWFVIPPILRRFLLSRLAVWAGEGAIAVRRAAAWMEGRGETGPAFAGMLGKADASAVHREAGASLVRGEYEVGWRNRSPSPEEAGRRNRRERRPRQPPHRRRGGSAASAGADAAVVGCQ